MNNIQIYAVMNNSKNDLRQVLELHLIINYVTEEVFLIELKPFPCENNY